MEGKDRGRCKGRVGEVRIKGGEEEEEIKLRKVLWEGEWGGDDEASQHFIITAARRDTCLQMIILYSFHLTALGMLSAGMQID